MGFFELFGIVIFLYYAISLFLWMYLDTDIELFLRLKFGKSISELNGKVVWITGASSGIGKHLAIVLAKNGAKLCISARREDELHKVKEECLAISSLRTKDIMVLKCDMLDTDRHEEYFQKVLQYFDGQLDVLVNNAGRSQRANWEDINVAVDKDLFDLDVFSAINLARIYVRHLEKNSKKGHLVVTSSVAGLIPVPLSASYSSAKHAINAYHNCLKMEKQHIDVTIFCPSLVYTDYLAESFTDQPGVKYGQPTGSKGKRMTVERCAFLMASSIVNKLHMSFVGLFPVPLLVYISLYYPNLGKLIIKLMDKNIKKLRDPEGKKKPL